jgi:sugar lactone lactonase YvrE
MRIAQRFSAALLFIILTFLAAGLSAQSLISNPECVSYDAARDRYLVSCFYTGQIVQIDSNGVESVLWTSPRLAYSNHIDGNLFYVSIENNYGSVAVIDLETDTYIKKMTIPGYPQIDGITTDTSGNLYVVASSSGYVIKLDLTYETPTILGATYSQFPQDLYFDSALNRVIVAEFSAGAPIQAISLPSGPVTNLTFTSFGNMDGIARDNQGRYYVSCYTNGNIYRFDPDFASPPVIVSSGHISPSNLCYDHVHDLLAIPNFEGNRVDFVGLSAEFSANVTNGKVPLTVDFSGSSINYSSPDSWQWDFGDEGTAEGQTTSHTYDSPGLHTVDLGVVVGSETYHRRKKNFIFAQADTLIAPQINGTVGSQIVIPIYIRNNAPLKRIVIPFNYSGDVVLRCDSITTTGCQTSGFTKNLNPFDDTNKKLALTLSDGNLEPGRNLVANAYMTILSYSGTRTTALTFNTVSIYQPRFTWNNLYYTPDLSAGTVIGYVCGDANGDSKINLLDISYIINALYRGGPKPNPLQAADVNHDGKMNLLDISYIINFLYHSGSAPSCS